LQSGIIYKAMDIIIFLLLPLAPQPSLGHGLLHKIRLNFLEASQKFSFFYRAGLLAPCPTPGLCIYILLGVIVSLFPFFFF